MRTLAITLLKLFCKYVFDFWCLKRGSDTLNFAPRQNFRHYCKVCLPLDRVVVSFFVVFFRVSLTLSAKSPFAKLAISAGAFALSTFTSDSPLLEPLRMLEVVGDFEMELTNDSCVVLARLGTAVVGEGSGLAVT